LSLTQIIEKNDKSFYLPYIDVQVVTLKKGLTGIGKMSIQTPECKYNCEFPKDQLDVARSAVAEKLSMKLES
jgi:hypothetical protein